MHPTTNATVLLRHLIRLSTFINCSSDLLQPMASAIWVTTRLFALVSCLFRFRLHSHLFNRYASPNKGTARTRHVTYSLEASRCPYMDCIQDAGLRRCSTLFWLDKKRRSRNDALAGRVWAAMCLGLATKAEKGCTSFPIALVKVCSITTRFLKTINCNVPPSLSPAQ